MHHHRTVAALAATLALTITAPAAAFTLGSADVLTATPAQLEQTATLGARVSRVTIDITKPLAEYDTAIAAREAAGMHVQVVIGGLYAGPMPTIEQAIAVHRRWPNLWTISLGNEPDLIGRAANPQQACEFRRTFNRIYRALKREGAQRVLFGELSPSFMLTVAGWLVACGPIVADGFAWHAYEFASGSEGRVTNLRAIRAFLDDNRWRLHTPQGFAMPMFITEYGQKTRGVDQVAEPLAAFRWRRAMTLANRYRVAELVAYGVHEAPTTSTWDSSIIDADGHSRQAAAAIFAHHG